MRYRRCLEGNCYFFTVVTFNRRPLFADTNLVDRLRMAFGHVRQKAPFSMPACVVLPDHLHCIWTMPDADSDFPGRWSMIKHRFSVGLQLAGETASQSRLRKRERGIWQRRYWEHQIRDDVDLARHLDYIHFNPVKHGYVATPWDWPYSSLAACARRGWYLADWGNEPADVAEAPAQTGE